MEFIKVFLFLMALPFVFVGILFLTTAHGRNTYGDASMEIVFGTLNPNVEIGVCEVGIGRKITIDPSSWATLQEYSRQNLIFHELGHCILNLGHDSTLMSNGIPNSLMNPSLLPDGIFEFFRSHYMNQLFGIPDVI
jgi:hypothetical protein